MAAIAPIKLSSILLDATTLAAGTAPSMLSLSATIGVDVSITGSPGNLDPEGFVPNGVAKWVDRSSGIQIGYPSLTVSSRAPTKTSRVTRIIAKYVSPTMEITSPATSTGIQPAPTKAYDAICNVEFVLPERMTLAERTAFYSRCLSLFLARIQASDASPSDATGSPLPAMVLNLDKPY